MEEDVDQIRICICLPQKRPELIEFHHKLLENSLNVVKSQVHDLGLDSTSTENLFNTTMNLIKDHLLQKKENPSVTLVSLRGNKKMISIDKLLDLEISTQPMKLLEMLVLGLIGNGRVSKGFWRESCKEGSKKLSFPTEIGSVDSLSNLLNGYSLSSLQKSSFSTEVVVRKEPLQKTSSLLSMSTPVDRWDEERIQTRHLRISVSRETEWLLEMWAGHCRRIYNDTSALLHERTEEGWFKHKTTDTEVGLLRKILISDKEHRTDLKSKQCEDVPKDVRAGSFYDAVSNCKTGRTLLRQGTIRKFGQSVRTKKSGKFNPLVFEAGSLTYSNGCFRFYPTKIKAIWKEKYGDLQIKPDFGVLRTRNIAFEKRCRSYFEHKVQFPDTVAKEGKLVNASECRVIKKNGEFYLSIVGKKRFTSSPRSNEVRAVAIDPGVRKMITTFDSDGNSFMFRTPHSRMISRMIESKTNKLSKLQNDRKLKNIKQRVYHRQRFLCKKKLSSIIKHRDNLASEAHYKIIRFLLDNYDVIIYPKPDIQGWVKNEGVLHATTKKMLSSSQLGKFGERLESKLSACHILVKCTEEYTSKTCSSCGSQKKIGSMEKYKCDRCNFEGDRDINGAKNILLKFLSETVESPIQRHVYATSKPSAPKIKENDLPQTKSIFNVEICKDLLKNLSTSLLGEQ